MNFEKCFYSIFIRFALLTPLLITLQACADTKLGNQLANSFDVQLSSQDDNFNIRSKKIEENRLPLKPESKEKILLSNRNINIKAEKNKKKMSNNYKPQPYRIIIKLSGANPSAPAETLTKALRLAGVQFEVESIEKIKESTKPFKTSPLRSNR